MVLVCCLPEKLNSNWTELKSVVAIASDMVVSNHDLCLRLPDFLLSRGNVIYIRLGSRLGAMELLKPAKTDYYEQ